MAHFSFSMGYGLEVDCEARVLAQISLEGDAARAGGCASCSSEGCSSSSCETPSTREYLVLETEEVVAVRGESRSSMPARFAIVESTSAQPESALRAFKDSSELEAWLVRTATHAPELVSALRAQMPPLSSA